MGVSLFPIKSWKGQDDWIVDNNFGLVHSIDEFFSEDSDNNYITWLTEMERIIFVDENVE